MINDEEDLIKSLQSFVKANLNTAIDAINTEKADFLIKEIPADDDHYVFAGELLELPNSDFVNFGINGSIKVTSTAYDKITLPVFAVEVCFDNPKTKNTYFKSLRYMRAIYQTLLQYQESVAETDGFELTMAVPMIVPIKNRSIVVSGVYCQVGLS